MWHHRTWLISSARQCDNVHGRTVSRTRFSLVLAGVHSTGAGQYWDLCSVETCPEAQFTREPRRSFEDFEKESIAHGWPSFRDAEVVWEVSVPRLLSLSHPAPSDPAPMLELFLAFSYSYPFNP
jgi:hypothetical protein